jgi:hypothetical protein
VEEQLEFKELRILLKKGSSAWIQKATIRIFNKEPFYEVDLMAYYTKANTIDVAEDLSLGIQLLPGNSLAVDDKIIIFGTALEEKKNNGNEELAARIEALELALERITDMPAGTLLGRAANSGAGSAQQLALVDLGILPASATHRFRAAASIPQTIPAATPTKIIMNSEITDTNNQYNPSLSRLTAITNESWQITVFVTFNPSAAARLLLFVYRNGVEAPGTSRLLDIPYTGSTANFVALRVPVLEFTLAPTDFLEVFAFVSPGVVTSANTNLTDVFWSGKRIA